MGMLKNALRLSIVAKLAQVAQREASKPENRKKISDAVAKLRNRGAAASSTPPSGR